MIDTPHHDVPTATPFSSMSDAEKFADLSTHWDHDRGTFVGLTKEQKKWMEAYVEDTVRRLNEEEL